MHRIISYFCIAVHVLKTSQSLRTKTLEQDLRLLSLLSISQYACELWACTCRGRILLRHKKPCSKFIYTDLTMLNSPSCRPFFTLLLSEPVCTFAALINTMLNNITTLHCFKILHEQGAKEDAFLKAFAEPNHDISPLANGTSGELQVLLLLDCICLYKDVAIKGPLPPFMIIVEKGKKETTRQQKDENTFVRK